MGDRQEKRKVLTDIMALCKQFFSSRPLQRVTKKDSISSLDATKNYYHFPGRGDTRTEDISV
jgi:hypothetical protein